MPKDVDLNTYGDAIALSWTPEEDEDNDVTGYEVTWYPSDETDPSKKKKKEIPKDADEAFIQDDLEPLTYYTVELSKKGKDAGGKPLSGKPWKMVGVVVGKPDRKFLSFAFILKMRSLGNKPDGVIFFAPCL